MPKRDIIAIGGSAGSGTVLKHILRDLPDDLPASIFVTTHVPSHSPAYVADMLAGTSAIPVAQAVDGQPIERNRVYVAAPDRHLMLIDGTIRLGEGPRENMARPAIDPLFRSAALSYGPRAVGVVLSGMLNDGAAGLHAVKSVGGTAIVQHPIDAEADQMPLAALEAANVDHVASKADLASVIAQVARSEAGEATAPSDSLLLEVEIASGTRLGSDRLRQIADPSPLSCPDCQGVLSEMRSEGPLRYRCQIGHSYTAEILASRIDEVDQAVRVAMRVMEERVTLVERMAQDARESGRTAVAELYDSRAEEYRRYATTLRDSAILTLRMGRAPREQEI